MLPVSNMLPVFLRLTPHIHLIITFSVLSKRCISSTFIGQVSLPYSLNTAIKHRLYKKALYFTVLYCILLYVAFISSGVRQGCILAPTLFQFCCAISIECLLNSVLFLMRLYKQTFPRLLFSLDPPLIRSNGKHLIA